MGLKRNPGRDRFRHDDFAHRQREALGRRNPVDIQELQRLAAEAVENDPGRIRRPPPEKE
jgi:hypothetical protein